MSNELSLPLSLIFPKSFSEGELPQDWKDAITIPLHKKGEKEFASNYRPISLTSIVCKVMELIIKDQYLLAYMVSNKLLTNLQNGFVTGKRCQSNLLLMLNFLTEAIHKHFFSIRVINNWNSLPFEVVNAVSLASFKSKLDNVWEDNICVLIKKL